MKKEFGKFSIECREETLDEYVCKEVLQKKVYDRFSFVKGDVVLDIGGNIGAFAIFAGDQGAKVHSFEPDPENFKLARFNRKQNFKKFPGEIHFYEAAIIGGEEAPGLSKRDFFLNNKQNRGSHSFYVKRGRDKIEVECFHINALLRQLQPTKLKIDAEGAEYEILQAVTAESMASVNECMVEFHFQHLKDKDKSKYGETITKLSRIFGTVDFKPITGGNWTTLIYARK